MCKQPPGPTSVWYFTSCKPGFCSPSKLTWKLHGMFKDLSMMYHASNQIIHVISDLSIMYHALWDRRHEGATRISQCTRRITKCTDVSEWYLECLRSYNARYILLKSHYEMNYLVLIHNEAKICKRSSEAGAGEPCIVQNLCMVLWSCA